MVKGNEHGEETGFGAQFADVHVNVQGRQYAPPPFGRTGPAMGPVIHNNPSHLYHTVGGGQVTPTVVNGDAHQQWLSVRIVYVFIHCVSVSPPPGERYKKEIFYTIRY